MTSTLWADVSSYQPVVDDRYPYRVLAARSNDGTFADPRFPANLAWARSALQRGRLDVLIVYFVWRPNWQLTIRQHAAMIGAPFPGLVSMLDVESWGGQITGDQSAGINEARAWLAGWYGNPARVIGYGNAGDLEALWPDRGDVRLVVADYEHNPAFPGKFAHQFANNYPVAPFGRCDINSADGYTVAGLKTLLGLNPPSSPASDQESDDMPLFIVEVDPKECAAVKVRWPGIFLTDGRSYLRHIAGATSTGDNLTAYTSVGIPRAKTPITLAEYHALGGV